MRMDRIELKGMAFYGYHGCLPEEREKGQRFFVDLTLFTDLKKAGETDELADTVNYAEVYGAVKNIVEGTPRNLIEAVAESVAKRVLAFSAVQRAAVTIRKPSAPIGGKFDDVAVCIVREKGDAACTRVI